MNSLGAHPTDLHRAKLIERQNGLQRRIDAWRKIQVLFMPTVIDLLHQPGTTDSALPYDAKLHLPSAVCSTLSISPVLLEYKWRLRMAQALDSLSDIRRRLEVRAHMYKYKDRFTHGQRDGTRSRTLIKSLEAKIGLDADRYRGAYTALSLLAITLGKAGWSTSLRPLLESDIRHVSDSDFDSSEGRRQLSWIWLSHDITFRASGGLTRPDSQRNLQECEYNIAYLQSKC